MSKSCKRSLKKGKHGGLAAKTVKEQKPLSHLVPEFFLLLFLALWKLAGRMLVRVGFGSREKKKEPSLSRERLDAASSSSALATPSGASVAAKRASEERTEGPAVERLSSGTVNDKDPCDDPNSNEALKLDPEVLEAEFSRNRVGGIFRVDRVGYHKKEEAEVNLVERLHETLIEDDEVKCERPGSDNGDWKKRYYDLKKKYYDLKKEGEGGDWKKRYYDLKKEYDDLKKEGEVSDKMVKLRQVLSDFRMTQSAKDMDDGIKKEVLKLEGTMREQINRIIAKVPFTRIVFLMLFQRSNVALKSSFCCCHWRSHNHFPNFSNDSVDYKWWDQNFVPKKLGKRLRILRVAAKKWKPELEIFRIIEIVSGVNSRLHRQPSENEFNEKDEVKVFEYEGIDLQRTIRYLRSGGKSEHSGGELCRSLKNLR